MKKKTEKEPIAKEGDLKVYHIPQVPMKGFEVLVKTVSEGKLILDTLAKYDIFQFENNIKPDYCNAGGLMVFEDGEWLDWDCKECYGTVDDCECEKVAACF